ncbi:Activated RNA polymerase II transcriptional coactivator p15 [Melipona quadrifasciata]|uniref:Activated RNA polymerase II transcriptional coactivator p15 n=1 Tax=Melipona quadrifasciata TaxID=166423 RepID=A0A0M8ZW93_9HYME|nr:Activated RNA polymerase II transcriptional coactivator p15 [Melipona quadrifasciata]
MPKSKEFIYSDDDSSDEEVKSKKRKRENGDKEKKTAEKESAKNEDVWDLGNNRRVTVKDYRGKFFVDIREMYFDKELNLKPARKGISLSIPQWQKLLSVVDDVDKAIKSKC